MSYSWVEVVLGTFPKNMTREQLVEHVMRFDPDIKFAAAVMGTAWIVGNYTIEALMQCYRPMVRAHQQTHPDHT